MKSQVRLSSVSKSFDDGGRPLRVCESVGVWLSLCVERKA